MAHDLGTLPTELSPDQVLLLAAHYASGAKVAALRILIAARQDVLDKPTSFAILLYLLPETLEPDRYVDLIDDVDADCLSALDDSFALDASLVQDISTHKARSQAQQLCQSISTDTPIRSAEEYIVARSHRIEQQTGLLTIIPALVQPFVQRYPELQIWYISNVLPLVRLKFEYYAEEESRYTLEDIEMADDETAADLWLSRSLADGRSSHGELARDLRGLVGPWIHGSTARKRRKLDHEARSAATHHIGPGLKDQQSLAADMVSSWTAMFDRLIARADTHLPTVADAMDRWSGPTDVDVGDSARADLSEDVVDSLNQLYTRAGLACVYAADGADPTIIASAWIIAQSLDQLKHERGQVVALDQQLQQLPVFPARQAPEEHVPSSHLEQNSLLAGTNALTAQGGLSLELARFYILSAKLLALLGHPVSVAGAFKVKTYLDAEEQASLFKNISHALTMGKGRTDEEWHDIHGKLLWLYTWGRDAGNGNGIFGKLDRKVVEKHVLEMLLFGGCNSLVLQSYLQERSSTILTVEEIEQVIASTALQCYDSASNGNRTRGSMKKANAIITAFSKQFTSTPTFARLQALIAATHAMSSYSLTLQHGVPFTPVSIRVSSDPIGLIEKVLAQNTGSYAKAQDLVSIATNFVAAGLTNQSSHDDGTSETSPSAQELESMKKRAQRRVVGMAVEAALHEDDFETAYSYVVNWLDTWPTTADATNGSSVSDQTSKHEINEDDDDDIAWRAALAAGKHKSTSNSSTHSSNTGRALRRLEQRLDLLSQALLLAPSNALPEILTAWRKCEEEMSALLASDTVTGNYDDDEAAAAHERDVPGSFVDGDGDRVGLGGAPLVQARREVGRGAAEEAPMGLFDVARGAAAAFSKSAFPLRRGGAGGTPDGSSRPTSFDGGERDAAMEQERVRKRDQLANAVTGGLASGIGWVLGANPVLQRD